MARLVVKAVLSSSSGCILILVVPYVGIHEAEEFAARSYIDHLVYVGQREAILGTDFVRVGKVDAYYLFLVLLFHQGWIGEPIRIKYFSDEANLEESVYFLIQCSKMFNIYLSRLLLYWLCFRENG